MGERLIKPYEISVWEDKLTQNGFEEVKLAVIGSNLMTGPNKIYDPVFTKNTNGEKRLSFSLKYKYFDPYSGNEDVVNPFAALLINERKIKLHYDDQWYEFIIKDHSESSDGLTWTYNCNDAFILELSKNGYNITFDSELNNNQGTARELAEITLENTDWQVGNTDILKQYIKEPVYKAVLNSKQNVEIINISNNEQVPAAGTNIYVFYSYVKNKDGKFVQFIIRDDNRQYTIDDKNVITDTNFRIKTELIYENNQFKNQNGTPIITLEEIENRYQVNRLAYGQLTTYDPIMERTVDRFVGPNDLEVYKYTDYKYTTSNLAVNYITNGNNFNALEDGTLQGWNPYTDQSDEAVVNKLELVTKPELGTNKPLATLSTLSSVEGFLKVQFNGTIGSGPQLYNTVYNSGIENNVSLIDSISKGDEFIFRWRAATGDITNLVPTNNLRLIVAKYVQDLPTLGYYYKHININDIILKFEGEPIESYNYITGGTFVANEDNTLSYVIDGVPQVPSTKYIYKSGNEEKIWNGLDYEPKTNNNYRPYYYLKGTAEQAVSNAALKNAVEKIGIFIYNTVGAETYFIQDIQLTRYYEDADGNPLFIGNAPAATYLPIDYYYVKPAQDTVAEDVHTYTSLEELAVDLNISASSIKPLYNEDSEKILSISIAQSNCFNILQTIAETFECWIDLEVQHDNYGRIIRDNNVPRKFVHLREYVGHDNWAGFKYGINLQNIDRTVNSEEIVTKLIVNDSQSDLVDEGYISISNAPSNQSGESYILNFDYYYNQGLLNREEAEQDKNDFISALASLNSQLKEKETKRRNLENAFTALTSNRNVYSELIATAQDNLTRNLGEFESLKKMSYEEYQAQHETLEPAQQLTEDETLYSILAELYNNSAIINNYSGLLSTVEKQWNEINQELNGIEGVENSSIKDEIDQLIEDKKTLINNFENKYRKYILEGTWNSTDYIDSELYYLDAVQVSNTSSQPIISYTIGVVEISQLEGFEHYNFDAGDKTYIEDTEFFGWTNKNGVLTPAREEVIISEVEWHLDNPDENTITVQNYKSRFEDLFQRVSAAVQTVQYNEATYAKISSLLDANGTINQDVLLASLNNISGKNYNLTSDGSVLIDEDRVLIRNLTNPTNCVIINSEGIRISSDGGQTWRTAIDGQGINIGTVYTGTLNTNNVIIGNSENPSFRWDKSGINAYKFNGTATNAQGQTIDTYDLQTFVRYDQNGLYGIKDGDSYNSYTLEQVKDKAHFAVTWDGFFIKNSYPGGGRVEITSDNDFRVMNIPEGQVNEQEKVKIGALEWGKDENDNPILSPDAPGATEAPTLYGIRIKNDAGETVMQTGDDGNLEITGTIYANAGEIGGMTVNSSRLTMDTIVLEPHVGIYSTEQIDGQNAFIISDVDGSAIFRNISALGGILGQLTVQDTITVGDANHNGIIQSNGYTTGITGWAIKSDGTAEFQNAIVRGEVNAGSGNFYGTVTVGRASAQDQDYIIIDGHNSEIRSANYSVGGGTGWMINNDGDAYFMNITARGAIKTAVFEYAEIQAVGGVFLFRPSSTIKSARTDNGNLIVTVEKPILFAKVSYNKILQPIGNPSVQGWYERTNYGYQLTEDIQVIEDKDYFTQNRATNGSWCKVSNYTADGVADDSTIQNILLTNGLTHVYKVIDVNLSTKEITLQGAAVMVEGPDHVTTLKDLEGGALVDMGREDGSTNYGIGVNSSDNTVNLPARAISLFETEIKPNAANNIKVNYKYKGILGTLPTLSEDEVNGAIYNNQMAGTQGIYTDNMYLGDKNQYIAFYEDEHGDKQLRIKANQIVYEITDEQGHPTGEWKDVQDVSQGADGEDAITVRIDSSAGTVFLNKQIITTLTCTVTKGNGTDITNQVTRFTWSKKNADGTVDTSWSRPLAGNTITISEADVTSKAIFTCEVEF